MRKLLDGLYTSTLALSAACLVVILVLVGAQICGQIFDETLKLLGYPPYGFLIPSLSELGGYLFGAASFLALGATFKRGAHIRVTMLLGALKPNSRRLFEYWALIAGFVIVVYAAWSLGTLTYFSWKFGDVSSGLLPIKYWIPQAAMTLGLFTLCIALLDELAITYTRGTPSFANTESAVSQGLE